MSKILITGATGHLGKATIEYLLQKTTADNIVAFARDKDKSKNLIEKGIEVRYVNFDDIASLDKAMQGIEKVLLISGVEQKRLQQHINVVDTAKKAGVKYIAYTSVSLENVVTSPAKDFMITHFQTEDYLKVSGLDYTIFRNTLYADVLPMFVGEKVFETGIFLPTGDGKVPYALRKEMGEAIANVLLENTHGGRTYKITGSELYSFTDIAQILSEISGKTIIYTDAEQGIFQEQLKQFGLPDFMIHTILGFVVDIKNHQYESLSNDLENLLGRKPATLKEALKEIYSF